MFLLICKYVKKVDISKIKLVGVEMKKKSHRTKYILKHYNLSLNNHGIL